MIVPYYDVLVKLTALDISWFFRDIITVVYLIML